MAAARRRKAVRHRPRVGGALNSELLDLVEERQIYRIDHYLGKETVQNILVLRFANGIFEPIWNRNHIDHVQITVAETVGVGQRGSFYDATGALRDMVPNHLFQLLALVAMEPPNASTPSGARRKGQGTCRDPDPERGRRCTIRCAASTGRQDRRTEIATIAEPRRRARTAPPKPTPP